MDARNATLIVNPLAGRARPSFDSGRVRGYLEKRGWAVTVVEPSSAVATTGAAAQAAAAGHHLVLAFGGDGTVRDVAEGLAGSATALAPLPGGTVNVWCRETGIPLTVRAAVDAHLAGQVVAADLGRAGDSVFLLMASAGWDAEVTRTVDFQLKARIHDYAYVVRAAMMLPRLRTVRARWRSGVEVEERPLALMVLSNTALYGGRFRPSPDARAVDGLLDVVALCPAGPLQALRLAYRVVRSQASRDDAAVVGRVPELTIETPGIPVQLDGDFVTHTPLRFSIDPGALQVSVPAGPLPRILRRPSAASESSNRRD